MPIVYSPSDLLNEIAPKERIEKMLTKNVTLKKTALSFVKKIPYIDEDAVSKTALKVVKNYKARIKDESASSDELTTDPKLLVQRVQNEVIFQVKEIIKENYAGEKYEWLPSDAMEPDPLHQLNYGQVFIVGEGEMPGDRIGCRCGMRILTEDNELQLS